MESQSPQTHRENIRVDFARALEDMHTLLDTKNFVLSSNFHEEIKKRCTMIFRRLFQKVNVTIDRDAEQK
ncbi:hypothetical protein JTB14_029180 [Gonioctena quinquepunctata]|nr:hypothetical protein JTB14_029180 [Gonioctena quinquepunctata]